MQEFTLQLLEVEIFFVDKFWLKPKVLLGQGGLEMDYGPPFFSIAGPTGDSDISRRNEEEGGFIPSRKGCRWRGGEEA